MQPKTKNYLTIAIILSLASLFLLISISDQPNKIVGNVIKEIELLACEYAEEGGTCFTRLEEIGLITPEECCRETGKCCIPSTPREDSGIGITTTPDSNDARIIERSEEKHTLPSILEGLDLPEEYEIIYGPFNVECDSPVELVTNIPVTYKDIKIISCKGEQCYKQTMQRIMKEYQGDIVISVTKETEELEPELIVLKTEEISLNINSIQDLVQRGGTQFYGELFDDLTKTLPEKEEPEILDGPFTFNKDEVNQIKLPLDIKTHGAAIGLFAKKDDEWVSIESEIDKEAQTILADIEKLSEFTTEDNNIRLAIMGIPISQDDISFERIYSPEQPSRDVVILVHGLATQKETFNFLINDFTQTQPPFQLWTFSYSSNRYIDEIADDLSKAIEKNQNQFDRIFIVAHSMGGIVSQQALYSASQNKYSYLDKVKKVILIGSPNEGSIVAEAFEYMFSTLVQKSIGIHEIFEINEKFIDDLTNGRIIPKAQGVDYYVIAGTRPYTEGLLGLISKRVDPSIKFDGIVTTKSAQNIGGEYVNDMCKNYWEVDMTHMELVDDPLSRYIIGKIVYDEVAKTQETLLGKNKYYKFGVEQCSPDMNYIAIGRESGVNTEELIGCKCGDGFCGIGEDRYNCPADCAEFFAGRAPKAPLWLFISLILIILAVLFIWKLLKSKISKANQKEIKTRIKRKV